MRIIRNLISLRPNRFRRHFAVVRMKRESGGNPGQSRCREAPFNVSRQSELPPALRSGRPREKSRSEDLPVHCKGRSRSRVQGETAGGCFLSDKRGEGRLGAYPGDSPRHNAAPEARSLADGRSERTGIRFLFILDGSDDYGEDATLGKASATEARPAAAHG